MSLTQEQKDTIREEFEKWIDTQDPCCPMEGENKVVDWWLNKLDQAYQSGAKDKVDEVEQLLNKTKLPQNSLKNGMTTLLYIPNEHENIELNNRIDWVIKLIKDNT